MLLLTAIIWGSTFCAMDAANKSIEPWAFNAIRFILGGLVLIPLIPFLDHLKSPQEKEIEKSYRRKDLLIGGVCCGVALGTASAIQQIGIKYTTVGKAGFITACYIILVPIFGIFLKKRCSIFVWISIVIAVAGLYLLCMNECFSIAKGDLFVIACAFLFTFQILFIDHFAPKCDCVRLACIQFFVAGIGSLVAMLCMEGMPQLSQITAALIPILFAGIMSSGVAYTLQMIGQKNFNPTIASLIMSLESMFAAIFGWMFLRQQLTARELWGCGLMFIAIMLAQMPMKKKEM